MLPFVSIIMPIRNEEAYIARALDSIRQQDYPADRFEVLVVDGISDDRTREIVNTLQQRMPNVRFFNNMKKIVPAALNIGLTHCRGEIIIRVDGHVVLDQDYISQCVHNLERHPAACVGGIIVSVSESWWGEAIALAVSSPFGVGNARFRTAGSGGREGWVDCLAFGAYRRELFAEIGGFDEELVRCQDDEFNYRLRKSGGRIWLTPRIRSWYFSRLRPRQLWRQYFQYGFWKIRVMEKHLPMMQPRQFAPPLFVLGLAGPLLLAPWWPGMAWFSAGVALAWLLPALFFTLHTAQRRGWCYAPALPPLFLILHLSYGLGFWAGLFGLFFRHTAGWAFAPVSISRGGENGA